MAQYPTLRFIDRHGSWLSILVALAPLAASVAAPFLGASPWWIPAGAATAAVLFLVARSYVEMIRLMTDMLLPK